MVEDRFEPVPEPEEEIVEDEEPIEDDVEPIEYEEIVESPKIDYKALYREYKEIIEYSGVRTVVNEARELLSEFVEKNVRSIELTDQVVEHYAGGGYYQQSSDIEHQLEEGEGVTIPVEWWYNEDFYEYAIGYITIVPLLRPMSKLEMLRIFPRQCKKCTVQECWHCLGARQVIAFAIYATRYGKTYREFVGHYDFDRTDLYIIALEPIVLKHIIHEPITDEEPSPELERLREVYPIEREVKIEPKPELFSKVKQLYEKALEYKNELTRLKELIEILYPNGDIVWLENEEEEEEEQEETEE